ncbi:hypothetical protein GCM10010523_22860 [Paenarthrobacter ilicis]
MDSGVHQHLFEHGCLAHEGVVFVIRAEAHDPFHVGAVVPGAVEHDDLAGGGKVLDVALEIPLALLAVRGLGKRDCPGVARVKVFVEALDGAALAGRVPAFEDDHVLEAEVLSPVLEFQQLDLQAVLLDLILVPGHPQFVGIILIPGFHCGSTGIDQFRVLALPAADGVTQVHQMVDRLAQVVPDPPVIQ